MARAMKRPPLADRLRALIERDGPISVADWMALANAHYYASRDPLGAAGDFTTAPEISQMFGELVGMWLADLWMQAGQPDAGYVELGPGRGTLAADALRAMRSVGMTPDVHFIEASPVLRAMQAGRVSQASWHDGVRSLPHDRPLLVVANEFFDALPVRQLVRTESGWRERVIGLAGERIAPGLGDRPFDRLVPAGLAGDVFELSPARAAVMAELAARLADQGGAALIVDYGYSGPAAGDTLQAVKDHAYADVFDEPGERDLTAHVDFAALAREGRAAGLAVHGPVAQGEWLERIGLSARAAALARAQPARATEIALAQARLAEPEEMGTLFEVLALTSPAWPRPEGFA